MRFRVPTKPHNGLFTRSVLELSALLLLLAITVACSDGSSSNAPPQQPAPPQPPLTGQTQLSIAPSLQQTTVWCWAACAEMVFRHHNLPNLNPAGNFQCGIVAVWFGGTCFFDCSLCQQPIGVMSNMQLLINGYGPFALQNGFPSRVLTSTLVFRALTPAEVKDEIDEGRPIVIGITPGSGFALPNASQHIAVIVGYDFTNGRETIIVNDPFPFDLPPFSQFGHPYLLNAGATRLAIGQFALDHANLVNVLQWANTIYRIN